MQTYIDMEVLMRVHPERRNAPRPIRNLHAEGSTSGLSSIRRPKEKSWADTPSWKRYSTFSTSTRSGIYAMKAITLWQPWASLIAAGAKTIETRTWSPPHSLIGQPLAIHAAMTLVEPTYFPELVAAAVARALGDHWQRSIPTGAVLAVVTLAAAEQVDSKASNAPPYNPQARNADENNENLFGDYTPGRWMWQLHLIEKFNPPLPAKGRQGLWNFAPWKTQRQRPPAVPDPSNPQARLL